jgi:hypothetical protein
MTFLGIIGVKFRFPEFSLIKGRTNQILIDIMGLDIRAKRSRRQLLECEYSEEADIDRMVSNNHILTAITRKIPSNPTR